MWCAGQVVRSSRSYIVAAILFSTGVAVALTPSGPSGLHRTGHVDKNRMFMRRGLRLSLIRG